MVRTRLLIAIVICMLVVAQPGGGRAQEYTLSDLFRIGVENSNRVKISAENISIAESDKSRALSVLVPRLTAFGSYTQFDRSKSASSDSIVIQPDNQATWGVRLDQAFTVNGRELIAYNIAKEGINRNRFDYQAVREDYLISIAIAYYDVLKARKGLDIANANLDRLTAYRNAANIRLKVGEVTKTVLLRAEGELSGARSDQIRAQNQLELAKAVLVRVTGIPSNFALKEGKYEMPATATLAQVQDKAVKQRPELKSLEVQKKIAEDQVRYAKGAYWPQLGLAAVYSGADQNPSGSTFNKESRYAIASLNFPLFEGGLRKAEVNQSISRLKQSELALNDMAQTVRVEVENVYLDLETQKGTLQFLGDQLTFARDNYNAVSRQFEFGLASSLDVIDANNLLLSAERQVADATYNYQLAILRLQRATGGLQNLVLGDRK